MAIPIPDWLQQYTVNLITEYVTNQLDYVLNYEDKVEKLDKAVEKLRDEKERVHDKAQEAEDRYGREVYNHVKVWLDEVHNKISVYNEFKKDPRHNEAKPLALSNPMIRYDLSKRAQEIEANVVKVLEKEKHDNMNILSRWRGPLSMGFPLAEVDYVNFDSRRETMEKIMEKLKDPSARMIGVYGFAGVGKTTLVTQAANRALKDSLFVMVTMANVTQSPDIRKTQGQIADRLGIKLEEESEYGRAARIKERLKREKKNIVIILDDLCAQVDLNMLGISLQSDDASKKNLILKEEKSSTARNEKQTEQKSATARNEKQTEQSSESKKEETSAASSSKPKIEETSASSSKVTEECQNWCKVLLISEVKRVLTRMDVKEDLIFSLRFLEDKESVTLFKKMAGIDNNKNPEFEKLATKIVKKCKNLPMSIVTTARAVKNQTLLVWEETNQKLEGQNVTGTIESSAKLNYELLESEELKSIFLLCARMSRDALVSDLVKYCIGLGFLQGIYTVRDARGRVQMSLAKLKQSGLLSDRYSSDRFTMQNLVRAAALSISSQENHVFTLTGGKLDEWPDVDKLERYTAICLRHCDVIEKFPESMKCPRLRVFQVENNGPQLKIPDNFCQEMKELRVLILTGFSLSQLPSSIGCLTKLRMLCLEQCIIGKQQLCIIGKLTNLRILSFSGSDIESLPIELNQLSKLQIFDISNCSKLSKIPADVISRLTSLEELYMRNTQWWVEEGQNFSLSELRRLNQLTNLDLQIPSVAKLPNDLFFDKLYIYKIVIGSFNIYLEPDFKIPESYELSRFLSIREKDGCDIHSQKGIKMMFDRVEDLLLEKLIGVQDVFYALNLNGFPCLNHLSIVSNSTIEYLINPKDPRDQPEEAFTKLKSLHLYKLKKMKQICFCKLSLTSFAKLKVIKIKLCHELKSVFLNSMVENLTSLETVEVSECNSLKKIVAMQTRNANESSAEEPIEGTKILFHEKIEVSKLEIMELSLIPINQIWDEKSSFENLIHLDVKGCGNLKYLLSFSVAGNLKKLQRLFVSECGQMEYIFSQEQAKDKYSMSPKLKNIKLSRMRCLTKIWNSKVPIDPIDNLDTLIIEECDKLVSVFACDTVGIFQSLGSLTVKNCKSMKAIFDLADGKQHAKYNNIKLQDVHLETLPKLEQVLKRKKDQESVVNLNNIRKIWLQDCEMVENIFPASVDKTFKNLEYLVAWGCSRLKEIVAKGEAANSSNTNSKFEFPELTTIKFLELPNFTSFYPGDCELDCPKLEDLSIERCDKLKPFREETTNNRGRHILFPVEVINKLKSMQIESRYAKLSTGYNYRRDKLEELHLSRLRNIEILYSFLHHNPKVKSLWLNDCSFGVLVPVKRPAKFESLGVVPKLNSLNLTNLAQLKEIGFERDRIFQRIESLSLKSCPRLDTIAPSSAFFSHLTNLEVVDCDRLKYLVSLRTAESLVQLSTIKVVNCNSLREIVSEQGSEAEEEEGREKEENASKFKIVFRQLKALELVSLKSLESFCKSKNCVFQFPSLEKFVVNACSKLKNFTEKVEDAIVLQKVYTVHEKENRWCWNGNLQATIQYIFQSKKFLEGMDELNVSDHPELEKVWQCKEGPPKDWFYSLKILKLEDCTIETYAIPSNVLGRLKSLQELEVCECSNITFIFEMNDTKIRETPLRLKRLTLRWLSNVTHVWQQEQEDKQGILCFKNLQQVSVMGCYKLQTLLPAALARDLKMLEKLEVEFCDELPQIVGNEEEAADGTVVFPRLTSLMLYMLPKLTCFYSERFTVECPELDYLYVRDCGELELFESQQESHRDDQGCSSSTSIIRQPFLSNIKKFSKEGPPKDWFYSLKTLKLEGCKFETYAIPSNVLGRLKSLEELEVHRCSGITFIFGMNDIKIGETPPKLRKLTLRWLEHVTHVWQQEQEDKQEILSFKNLQQVSVYGCAKLKTLLPAALARDLKMLEKLKVKFCKELPQIVGKEEKAVNGTKNEFEFPRLTSLVLNTLPKLTCFYSESFPVKCPQLGYLNVRECGELELFQSQQESHREDQGCSSSSTSIIRQPFFSNIKGISKVEKLNLSWKDASVWLGQSKDQDLQYLSELYLSLGDYKKENLTLASEILEKAPYLEKMKIGYCRSLKEISLEETTGHLKRLELCDLDKLHSIRVLEYLPKLQQFRVFNCPRLTTLVQPSAAKMLTDLEEMYVDSCESMREIVGRGQDETAVQEIKFELLEMISLIDLPRLECFYSGNATLQLPSLIQVNIRGCPEMKSFSQGSEHVEPPSTLIQVSYNPYDETELVLHHDLNVVVRWLPVIRQEDLLLGDYPALKGIWLGEVQTPFDCLFRNLNSLVVKGCEFLSNAILPSHLLPFLNNLEELEVRKCDSVEAIFDVKDTATNSSNTSVIPLKKLTLKQLPTLRHVWNEDPNGRLSLPDLEEATVSECESIKSLFPASVPKDKLQKLDVRNCAGLVEIVAKEENHKLDMFPKVTSLTLWDLPKLRCICSGMSILDWPELENLDVSGCPMLTVFATDSLSSADSCPEEVEDHFTSEKHGIISAQKVPPNLERLSLGKENVVMIEQGPVPHVDLLLQNIKFLTLQGSDKDSDAFPHVFFSKVPLPSIQEFAVVDSAFKEIFPLEIMPHTHYTTKSFPSQPEKLELRSLCKLSSIGFEHTWVAPLVENLQDLKVLACTCLTNLALSTVSFFRLKCLSVEDCAGLKYLFTSSTAKRLVELEKMSITNCESVETVVEADEEEGGKKDEDVVIPKLSSLSLKKLPKLESFYRGNSTLKFPCLECVEITQCKSMKTFSRGNVEVPELHKLKIDGAGCTSLTNLAPSTVSFFRLTELNVEDCPGFKYLITSSYAKRLVELEKMSITNCESLETVVEADEEEGDKKDEHVVIPKLSGLSLKKLPKLESFYRGNSTLKFPCLECVEITQCKSMKTFSRDDVEVPELHKLKINGAGCTSLTNLAQSAMSFFRLTELNVEDCAGFKYLFTSSNAKRLVELEKMSITNCESLETIVMADDEEGDKKDEDVVFPDHEKLDVRNCAELEEVVAKDDETAAEEVSKKVAVFPKVTSLTLWDLPKLRCICSGKDILDWPMLKDLDVYHCQMLKIFATDFQNSPDLYLQGQDHFTTDKQGIISADKVPPNMERLSLNKEDFILIEKGLLPHVDIQLQKIKFLRTQGFNNDSDLLPPEVFFSMVSLPSIQEFGVGDSVFKEIFPSQMPGMDFTTKSFSQLEKLELRSLYRLESIGFEHTWVAPLVENLQHFKVLACTRLTNLAPSTVSFSRLTELNVEDCAGLKYLFTSSTARSLVELWKMSITNCESLETVIVADDEEGDKKDEDMVFPKLLSLSLKKLPKLESFNIVTNLAPSTLSFSRLDVLNVEDCAGLKYLFTSSTARSLVQLWKVSITNCESLETVVVADDEEGDQKDDGVVFPDLYSLSLKKLPELGSFYTGNSTLKFRSWGFSVEITQCKSMKTFSHGDVEVYKLRNLEIDGAKWDDDDLNRAVRQQFEKARKQP